MPKVDTKYMIAQFALAHFSYHVCTGVLIPLLPLMRENFGLNYLQSGILVSCYSISYGIGQIPMAIIADRFSLRLIIIWGLISISLVSIGVSLTMAFWQMIPLFVLLGLIGATYHAPATSYISQFFPPDKRGRALGLHNTGGAASFLLTPAMALGLAYIFNTWRASFSILALPAILFGIILWLSAPETQNVSKETGRVQKAPGVRSKEMNPDIQEGQSAVTWSQIVRALGIIAFLSMTIRLFSTGVRSYLPLYMVDKHNISPKLAGIVISLIAGSGIIGAPLGGALSDRFGRKPLILFSLSLCGPLLFAMTQSPYGIPLLLSLFLYGMTMSVRMPSMLSLIADVVPIGRRTTVLGIYYFIGHETTGLTTPVIGRLIDVYGLDFTFNIVAGGLCVISAVALLFRKHI